MDDATRRVLREVRHVPWYSRLGALRRRLVCRVHRHAWKRKMYGQLCSRCGIYEADR